jgi:hypothetical protein
MGAKSSSAKTVFVIVIGSLILASILFISFLVASQEFSYQTSSTIEPKRKADPTDTPLPTYTLLQPTATIENWEWLEMVDHNIVVYVPRDWNRRSTQTGWVPGDPPCTEYTLTSPDGNGLLTITTYCGGFGGESEWRECGNNPIFVDYERNAVRAQVGDNSFEYTTGTWGKMNGEKTILCSWGWLELPWIFEIEYKQMDSHFDFETIEKILLSMYSNE